MFKIAGHIVFFHDQNAITVTDSFAHQTKLLKLAWTQFN